MQFLPDALKERLESAAEILEDHDKFRIVTHYDADGISSAAVLSRTFMKSKKGFHTTFVSSFPEDLPKELPIIFTDIGNSHLEKISTMDEPVIVLDHHRNEKRAEIKKGKVFINPHDFGINGSKEVSGGTLAFLLSITYDETNWAKAIYGLAGAAADKQNVGGFSGVNKKILEASLEKNKIHSKEGLFLDGNGIKDALLNACDPYFPNVSGREKEIDRILKDLNIDPEAPVDKLPKEKDRKLVSLLVLSLIEHNIPPRVIESIKGKKYLHTEHDWDMDVLYKLLNACARVSKPGLGLSLCLGDSTAMEEAAKLRKDYRAEMIKKLHKMEDKGIEHLSNIQYFYEEKRTRKGELAGLGMLYFLDQSKPTIGITVLDDKADISCRGTRALVDNGLDLGAICKEVSGKLDGRGGGHDIAAGATIPKEKVDEFLKLVNNSVGSVVDH
ncbi:MAG: DHH family phosphoesterase [Thermoplasmata archaeon]